MILSDKQNDGIKAAGKALKDVFPDDNLQVSLNLAKDKRNVNFNIKMSGILPEKSPLRKEQT